MTFLVSSHEAVQHWGFIFHGLVMGICIHMARRGSTI